MINNKKQIRRRKASKTKKRTVLQPQAFCEQKTPVAAERLSFFLVIVEKTNDGRFAFPLRDTQQNRNNNKKHVKNLLKKTMFFCCLSRLGILSKGEKTTNK